MSNGDTKAYGKRPRLLIRRPGDPYGISHSDLKAKSTILIEQFGSVFTKEDLETMPSMSGTPFPKMEPFTITNNGVLKLLRYLTLHNAQGPGNISSHICENQILITLQDISANLDNGEQKDKVLLDFSTAFNKIPHQLLLLKLRQ